MISQLDCDIQWKVDFIWQLATTSSEVGPRSSKALPKTKLAPKRGHGHCLMVGCQSDPLQLSESQRNHYIWDICSANRWDALKTAKAAASIGQEKGPILHNNTWLHDAQPTLQKFNELGYEVLPHPLYSPHLLRPTTTSSSISTTFCRENTSTTSRKQKCFPRVPQIPKHKFLCYSNK